MNLVPFDPRATFPPFPGFFLPPLEKCSQSDTSNDAEPLVLKAATPRINKIFGSDENGDLQNVLEKISQQYLWGKLSRVLATATGCYDVAASLPAVEKLEAFLDIIEDQRARHLQRHENMAADSIFSEADMQEIYGTWMKEGSWMDWKKLQAYLRAGARQQ